LCPSGHNMAYIRAKKSGGRTYYYLVEGKREEGKVRQKVLKYLGTSPNRQEVSVNPSIAGTIAQTLMSGSSSDEKVKEQLTKLGIVVKGRIKKISLNYTPPLGKLTLRVE
jgi:hypothetical protein